MKNIADILDEDAVYYLDYLKAEHRTIDNETVYAYLEKLEKAYLLHRCSRYDLQGKELLKTQEKFYLADTSLRYAVLGYNADTVAASLENVVYLELCRRGYTLGIISDLVGRREVDEWLDQDGLRPYFQTVQQSSVTYIRKPGPAIYYYAMEEVGAEPENCCYVGDNLNRDIIGAKAVDFGMTVTVQYQKDKPLKLTAENRPDAKVYRFPDLLDIFPKRGQVAVEKLIPPEDGQ